MRKTFLFYKSFPDEMKSFRDQDSSFGKSSVTAQRTSRESSYSKAISMEALR